MRNEEREDSPEGNHRHRREDPPEERQEQDRAASPETTSSEDRATWNFLEGAEDFDDDSEEQYAPRSSLRSSSSSDNTCVVSEAPRSTVFERLKRKAPDFDNSPAAKKQPRQEDCLRRIRSALHCRLYRPKSIWDYETKTPWVSSIPAYFERRAFREWEEQGHPYPTTTILQQEYRRYSTAMSNGVYSRSSPSIQHELRPLVGTPTPATNAWHFLTSKYEAIDIRLQLQLQEQLLGLRLDNGKADKYLSKARELRDRMITAQLPVTSSHFNGYLLHGLPDSWESFKSSIKLQLHTLSEDHLGNLILQEDRDRTYKRTTSDSYRSTSEAMLATKSSCDVCGKDGHVRAQCFFEPPYYCPRCKEKGHKPTECPKRNTRNNNATNNFKGNNRSRNNNHNKNKTYAQEASMHMETMLHMEYGEHALATKKMHGPSTSNPHEWIVDSGCTKHMTPYVIQLNNYERLVMTGSREVIYAVGIGDAPVLTNTNTPITLRKVLHVPKLMYPLMSVVQIVKNHGDVLTKKHTIQVRRNDKLILTAPHKCGLFRTILRVRPTFDPHVVNHVQEPLSPKGHTSLSMEQDKDAFILAWHKKLGHASHGAMQIMVKHNMAHGLPFKFVPKFTCHDCEIAKLTQQPYQLAQHLPSTEKLGLVHTDICGPVPTSMEGYRYFATLTDDATCFKWILPLKTKGEVITKIIEWLPYAERQSGAKMKAIRSDHGMEFKSSTLENFLKERGIEHQFSIVYHPPQNGVAERTNRTLVERTRAMLLTARMPTKY